LRIEGSGKLRRIAAIIDVGDLSRREGDHLMAGVVPEDDVEVVEVAAGGTEDDDAGTTGAARAGHGASAAGTPT
jgi:hypothetical protein